MASVPPPVLGGAALAMFATVAVVGIQTLARVDFHDHRNVIVVAVSIAIAMITVGLPQVNNTSAFLVDMPKNVQAFMNSGITLGSVAAILLNLLLNHFGGRADVATVDRRVDMNQLNTMGKDEFVALTAPVFQGDVGIAERVADRRPFGDATELRAAFQDELFSLTADQQVALMRSYPTLAGQELLDGDLGEDSVIDQAAAGLTFLNEEDQVAFARVNAAYRDRFGFPLIIAVRSLSAEQVLQPAGRAWTIHRPRSTRRPCWRSPRSPTTAWPTRSKAPNRTPPRIWSPRRAGTDRPRPGAAGRQQSGQPAVPVRAAIAGTASPGAAGGARSAPSCSAASRSTGAAAATASSVIRVSGPDMEMAIGRGASGTATATQRTPSSCSPSSMA